MSKRTLTKLVVAGVRGRRWTAEVAEQVLAAHEASGESLASFARRQGLPVQRLLWWRRRLADWEQPARAERTLVPAVIEGAERAAVKLQVGEVTVGVADAGLVPARWVAELVRALGGAR
jgi:transposase-like protein